jgi:hypothetical protein
MARSTPETPTPGPRSSTTSVPGELLLEAKERVGYGQFGSWLKANFRKTQQTADTYMWLAKERRQNPELESALSIRAAKAMSRHLDEPQPPTRLLQVRIGDDPESWEDCLGAFHPDAITDILALMGVEVEYDCPPPQKTWDYAEPPEVNGTSDVVFEALRRCDRGSEADGSGPASSSS